MREYYYHYYDPTHYATNIRDGEIFASCCGARYRTNKPIKPANGIGIVLFNSQVGKEYETPHNLLKHVATKNGVVTVMIKKAWKTRG